MDDECCVEHQDRDWYNYWRLLFHRVEMKDIEDFEKSYKGLLLTSWCFHWLQAAYNELGPALLFLSGISDAGVVQ